MKKKMINRTGTFATVVFVLFCMYCICGVLHERRTGKLFYVCGFRPVVVLSGSMEPYMRTGAVVIVRKTENIREQDAVFFLTEDRVPVIHRLIGMDKEGKAVTKGDANPKEDFTHIKTERIEGKVVLRMNWIASVNPFVRI